MTSKQPPRIATWMLKHFGSGPDIETLLGDLAEQYQEDSSAIRYWRQAMKAIPVSFFRDVRAHKWSVAKALMTGWVLWILAANLIFPIVFYDPYADESAPQVSYHVVWNDPRSWIGFMAVPAIGPTVHWKDPGNTLTAFLFAIALPAVVGAISGWLATRWQVCVQANPATLRLARVDRDRQTGVVLLFAGSVLLMNLLASAVMAGLRPPIAFLVPLLLVNAAASVLGILLGGGLFRDRSRLVSN
jgi:hypothetical protein